MLPFYKTFPFMDYYKNEDAFAKDLGMIKDMYPLDTAMIQSAVEQRMDELEYEGSFIYDEVQPHLMSDRYVLYSVTVLETDNQGLTYYGNN